MERYTISEKGNFFYINGTKIPDEIFEKEQIDFKILNRENFLEDLIHWISEAKSTDKFAMMEDLKELINIEDKYILSSIDTNYYLYGNSEEFNNTCEAILALV